MIRDFHNNRCFTAIIGLLFGISLANMSKSMGPEESNNIKWARLSDVWAHNSPISILIYIDTFFYVKHQKV